MSSAAPATFSMQEPIPGYPVRERLGAGGYGEVWKCDAPGGLAKAIKIVYGCRDDERAGRELAALNRIKQVRHPFLLSLERIERIDGHLVIVTELATSSLKQEFDKYRAEGEAGLPRRDLLSHLVDAADALDYISQQHCLQHLDVKPENLLLVGGRIKVADFGLVKDLQDVNCSIVGGMTPVYAAPELFDGRPSIHSDQYSLAIVYTEMLTGQLPYDGRTTAQLAAQHLHGRPRLDRLPVGDEPIIARALAKDAEQRFRSCREMIECLVEASPSAKPRTTRLPRPAIEPVEASAPMGTEVLSPEAMAAVRQAARPTQKTVATEETSPVRNLPLLQVGSEDFALRPTILIGIGGMAGQALRALHERIEAGFGDPAGLAALQFLVFDTDAESLKAVTDCGPAPLPNESAILLPLRPSAEYRNESSGRFNWLSRRWIYNIPRNLQTQGLRPLGRLALVDNMERAIERVKRAIRAAIDPATIVATAAATGLPFSNPAPRVFIVSSTTGGTGGGMALDFGYIVRHALNELKQPADAIYGILAHCTGRVAQARDLSLANGHALLGELSHYSDPRHFHPGDPGAGLPRFMAGEAPFSDAYVLHLGEELDASGFVAAAETLAKYLYYGSTTAAARFFDRCRDRTSPAAGSGGLGRSAEEPPQEGGSTSATVRNFGLCQLGFAADGAPDEAIEDLSRALAMRWRASEADHCQSTVSLSDPTSLLSNRRAKEDTDDLLRTAVAERAAAAGIMLEPIVGRFDAQLAEQMGNDREAYLLAAMEELLKNQGSHRFLARIPDAKTILDSLDGLVRYHGAEDTLRLCLETALDPPTQEIAAAAGGQLRDWLFGLVNSPDHRLGRAQKLAELLAEHLRDISRRAGDAMQAVAQQAQSLREALLKDRRGGQNWLRYRGFFSKRRLVADRRLSDYFALRLQEVTLNAFCRLLRSVIAQVTTVSDKLRNLSTDLNCIFRTGSAAAAVAPPSARTSAMQRLAAAEISARRDELLAEMEQSLENLLRTVATTEVREVRRVLATAIRRAARTCALRMLRQYAIGAVADGLQGRPHDPLFGLPTAVQEAALRHFANCGGGQRLLALAPEALADHVTPELLAGAAATPATIVADPIADMLLCYEVEGLPLKQVAYLLIDQRFHAVEAASRLHTRMDVTWTTF